MLEALREKLPDTSAAIRQKYDNTIAFVHAADEWQAHVERENLVGFQMVTQEEVDRGDITFQLQKIQARTAGSMRRNPLRMRRGSGAWSSPGVRSRPGARRM
jgi:hypothetical protein